MKYVDAERVAWSMLRKYGLDEWSFGWMTYANPSKTRVRSLGGKTIADACLYTKHIRVHPYFALMNKEPYFRNIMKHEIAHALVGEGHGHDDVWREKARSIGSTALSEHGKFNPKQ